MKKLNRTDAIALLRRFLKVNTGILKWYRLVKPYIKAIVFYGSTAKGLNKSGSDLDMLIFVPLEIEKKFTKGEYVYTFYGRKIDIVLRSIERLRLLAEESGNDFEKEVFRDCEILHEADAEVSKLIKKILNNK